MVFSLGISPKQKKNKQKDHYESDSDHKETYSKFFVLESKEEFPLQSYHNYRENHFFNNYPKISQKP